MCYNFKIFMQEENFLNFKNIKIKENQFSNSTSNLKNDKEEKIDKNQNKNYCDDDENDLIISKKKKAYNIYND